MLVWTDHLQRDQASLLQNREVHRHAFNDLQFLPQAVHETTASSFPQQGCGEISGHHACLILGPWSFPEHQQSGGFEPVHNNAFASRTHAQGR